MEIYFVYDKIWISLKKVFWTNSIHWDSDTYLTALARLDKGLLDFQSIRLYVFCFGLSFYLHKFINDCCDNSEPYWRYEGLIGI